MPKNSRYNHFQRWNDEHYIAYNARSGAVALMTHENYSMYLTLIQKMDSDQNGWTDQERELFKQLEYGCFICPDGHDELEAILFEHNMWKYNQTVLNLTIAPTMACNMGCQYCYEENKAGVMNKEVKESLLEFVRERAKTLERLDISWYGGEPLLAME